MLVASREWKRKSNCHLGFRVKGSINYSQLGVGDLGFRVSGLGSRISLHLYSGMERHVASEVQGSERSRIGRLGTGGLIRF